MSTVFLRRTVGGFVPDSGRDHDALRRFKLGDIAKADVVNPRNLKFFKKWWALIEVAFGLWEEVCPQLTYRGQAVRPNMERFRKDVTILAGFGSPVVNLKGEVRIEADSIAFGSMTEENFEKLYSATLDVILEKVLKGRFTEERLREMVDSVMEFA